MARDRSKPRVGRRDEPAAGPRVAGPHAAGPLGERLGIPLGEAGPEVPEQHTIPIGGKHRHRFGLADVDVREHRRRADHPDAGATGFREQVARCRRRQSHAVEAEGCDHLEGFAVVIEGPGKEWQSAHLEDAAIDPARRFAQGCRRRSRRRGRSGRWRCSSRRGHELCRSHGGIASCGRWGRCHLRGRRRCGGERRDVAHDEHVVDRHFVPAGGRVEFEHEMRDDGTGEFTGRAVFGAEREQLPLEPTGDIGHLEQFPAVGVLRHAARHEHLHRAARLGGAEVGEPHPRGQADVGPVGPHPDRRRPLVDHPCIAHGGREPEGRTGRRLDDQPLAGRAAVGGLARPGMGEQPVMDVRLGHRPARRRPLVGVFDGRRRR